MRLVAALAVVLASLVPATTAHGASADPFPGCTTDSSVVVGTVSCRLIDSAAVGGRIPFSYFVPPACAPATHHTCPVLYLLHGFGGDWKSMLGTAQAPSAWVKALTSGPKVDPHNVADPWNESDPAQWVAKPSIDMILVAPHGRTVPGGFGPAPDLDSFWADWNPRYAKGGDSPKYQTPPPRFEQFLVGELMPYVEHSFPTHAGREWRALAGTSLGGYGSYKNGLQHPDLWSTIGSVSGAHNFLFAPGVDPHTVDANGPLGLQPPAPLPYQPLPGVAPNVPITSLPSQLQGFAAAVFVLGDPVADNAYFRGNMPRDLAMNARARNAKGQALHIKGFNNDTVPRTPSDFANPSGYFGAQAFEDIVAVMNADMEAAFTDEHVDHEYEIHPGIHSGTYWNPYLRGQLEAQYARVRHPDGSGSPPAPPTTFDYRTVNKTFTIWGWRFDVDRQPVEFVNLRDVSCRGLRLQGTGKVTVTVPTSCHTGLKGKRTFTVDLGPSMPTDEPAGAGATPVYGRTVQVTLTRVRH